MTFFDWLTQHYIAAWVVFTLLYLELHTVCYSVNKTLATLRKMIVWLHNDAPDEWFK